MKITINLQHDELEAMALKILHKKYNTNKEYDARMKIYQAYKEYLKLKDAQEKQSFNDMPVKLNI